MAFEEDDAKKRIGQLLNSSSATRVAFEAYVGLSLAYAYGSQWASSTISATGGRALGQLKTIIDADRTDIRVALNFILPRITKLHSRLSPEAINTQVAPASGSLNDQVAAMVGNARMEVAIRELKAVRTMDKIDLWRLVTGTGTLRRCLWQGKPIVKRDSAGRPIVGSNGERKMLDTMHYAWEVAPPYEIIRDPSAYDVDFEGEDCVGHERPRTVEWLMRNFGIKKEELGDTVSTMGQLQEFQRFLYRATGQNVGLRNRSDSLLPGVMVGEWCFRDDESDSKKRWPWYAMTYRNVGGSTANDRDVKMLLFGPSPFHGLFCHNFVYEPEVNYPWGRGVPFRLIQAQDMSNIGYTNLLRRQQAMGSAKYVFKQNAVLEPQRVLGPNMWTPIPVSGNTSINDAVKRLAPPPMDPALAAMIQSTPQWFDWLLNMAPVQSGQSAGRHPEAGKAINIRLDAADTPLNLINRRDEEVLNEALTGTLFDIVEHEEPEVTEQVLSGAFGRTQIMALKEQDTMRSQVGVRVVPGSLRPRTREEVRQDTADDLGLEMIDPTEARRNMYIKKGIRVNERECRAIDLQTQEIQSMLDGREERVIEGQDHEAHIWRINLETESMRASSYSDEQWQTLVNHRQQHMDMAIVEARIQGEKQQAAGGEQPPAGEMDLGGLEPPVESQPTGEPSDLELAEQEFAALTGQPGAGGDPNLPQPDLAAGLVAEPAI